MKLPLKAKVAIRDQWEDKSSPAPQAISDLNKLLGKLIQCDPDFEVLLADLDAVYEDKEQFVTAVTSSIKVWCQALSEVLESTDNEAWTDKLLERLNESGAGSLQLSIQVGDKDGLSTFWSDGQVAFVLLLPRSTVTFAQSYLERFVGQLLNSIGDDHRSTEAAAVGDDWADVGADAGISAVHPTRGAARPGGPVLPSVDDLPRPDIFLSQPPYHLNVNARGNNLLIQGGHSPSLKLLANYLRKWCRTDANFTNKPALVGVELHKSPFCLGEVYDGLVLRQNHRHDEFPVSPSLVLNLITNILGYKLVHTDTDYWEFRRDDLVRTF